MSQGIPKVTEETYRPRGFWALIVTQFQGAFNDNVFQYAVTFFLIDFFTRTAADVAVASPENQGLLSHVVSLPARLISSLFGSGTIQDNVQNLATLIFSLPFIIFPAFFGALADRYSKQRIATWSKVLEVFIMSLGFVAFYFGMPNLLWFVLFLMATQSAMFGPAKYGIMPEILPEPRLSSGNGILQMGTMAAIIAGVGVAGPLYQYVKDHLNGRFYVLSTILIVLSCLGFLSSLWITRPPAADPTRRIPRNPLVPWEGMGEYLRAIWRDRVLFHVVVGYVYFWFAGVMVRNTILAISKHDLGLSESLISGFLAAVGIGIGVGAVAAGYLSRRKIELGLVPIGAVGMTVFSLLVAVPHTYYENYVFSPLRGLLGLGGVEEAASTFNAHVSPLYYFFLLGVVFILGGFAGAFDVPLAASIQQRSPQGLKGGIIAATNALTFVGMAMASIVLIMLNGLGISNYGIFFICALMSLAMGVYICWKLPLLVLRSILWFFANTRFRVHVLGRDNVPEEGAALLVTNAASMFDALALIASTDMPVRFVVGHDVLQVRWMRWVARTTRMILFDPKDPTAVSRTSAEIRAALREGYVVALSTELPGIEAGIPSHLHADYSALVSESGCPVIPVHISRSWGTGYRFEGQRLRLLKPPYRPHRIDVNYGRALPLPASLADAYYSIQRLGTESYTLRPLPYPTLARTFVHAARRHLRRRAIADAVSGELTYFKVLVGAIVFARKLKALLDKHEFVGLLVPPTVGGALANAGLQLLGRIPVNLNYTASAEALRSSAQQCNITHVITARKFLERLPLEVPGKPIYLEDIRESVTGKDRIVGMLLALFAPYFLLQRILGAIPRNAEDLATVIFSSGSEGEPKGVMLTHRNLLKNMEASLEIFPHDDSTAVVGFLPFFHSFGFLATLWLPLCYGLRAIYHPTPLEPKVIGDLIKKYQGNILIGTSTLLQGFIRRCTPEQLRTINFVVTGAEKLAPRVRLAFLEKFGIEPLEGYGTTECAPVVSVNIPDNVSPGFHYVGTRHGTIGRPIPGVSVRVVHPDSWEDLPIGEEGLLLVMGPNIMKGYLHQPEKTAQVLRDGWYGTGDIAALSADGFITITDRLARFSKIAGEMVPHTKVEEVLHSLLNLTDQMLAVAGVPDSAKGERLVVLHTLSEEQLSELLSKLDQSGLPNLWLPRANAFYRIEAIPVLGTGKMDIKTVKRMALEIVSQGQSSE